MAVVEKYQAIADRKEARLMAARGVKNTIVAANTARRKGNLEEAVTLYDEALQGLKEHPIGHSNRGYGHIRHIAVEQYVRGQRDALQSVIGKSAKEPSTSLPFPGTPAKRVRQGFLQSSGEVSVRLRQTVSLLCFVLTVCKNLWDTPAKRVRQEFLHPE